MDAPRADGEFTVEPAAVAADEAHLDALLDALQQRLKDDGVVARKIGNNLLAAAVALARNENLSMAAACDSVKQAYGNVPHGDARSRVKKYKNHIVGGNLIEVYMQPPAPADDRQPKPRGRVPKADDVECVWDDVDGCWRKGKEHAAAGEVHVIDHEARPTHGRICAGE